MNNNMLLNLQRQNEMNMKQNEMNREDNLKWIKNLLYTEPRLDRTEADIEIVFKEMLHKKYIRYYEKIKNPLNTFLEKNVLNGLSIREIQSKWNQHVIKSYGKFYYDNENFDVVKDLQDYIKSKYISKN